MSEADDLDRAADLTRKLEDAAVAEAQHQALPQQTRRADGTWPNPECADCLDALTPFRLGMGRIRCVPCQELVERRGRGL